MVRNLAVGRAADGKEEGAILECFDIVGQVRLDGEEGAGGQIDAALGQIGPDALCSSMRVPAFIAMRTMRRSASFTRVLPAGTPAP